MRVAQVNHGVSFNGLVLTRGSKKVECSLVHFHEFDVELVVLDNGPSRAAPRFHNLADAMRQSRCLAGTNGGFFDLGTFAPNGLMIAEGKSTGHYERDNWADGVLIAREHHLSLEQRGATVPDGPPTQLLQTGPWLVRHGIAQSAFKDDAAVQPRTFIATDGKKRWVLGHVSGSTLGDLAEMLCSETMASIMNPADALNLDGGPSSGLWTAPKRGPAVYKEEQTIVRNFIGIRETSSQAGKSTESRVLSP